VVEPICETTCCVACVPGYSEAAVELHRGGGTAGVYRRVWTVPGHRNQHGLTQGLRLVSQVCTYTHQIGLKNKYIRIDHLWMLSNSMDMCDIISSIFMQHPSLDVMSTLEKIQLKWS
jgi:hypothetical protein